MSDSGSDMLFDGVLAELSTSGWVKRRVPLELLVADAVRCGATPVPTRPGGDQSAISGNKASVHRIVASLIEQAKQRFAAYGRDSDAALVINRLYQSAQVQSYDHVSSVPCPACGSPGRSAAASQSRATPSPAARPATRTCRRTGCTRC